MGRGRERGGGRGRERGGGSRSCLFNGEGVEGHAWQVW